MSKNQVNWENSLWGKSEAQYGDNYNPHLLEQYKIYLDMADKISERRHITNNFFLTLNTGIISAIGIFGFFEKDKMTINKDYVFFLTISLLIFCYVWYRLIRSYKDLNSAKFKVIHEIEKKLPIRPFDSEWEALGRGKDTRLYLPFSKVEKFVPLIFGTIHFIIMLYLLVK
jgi:hypothetical protein